MRFGWAIGVAVLILPTLTAADPDLPLAASHLCGATAPAAPAKAAQAILTGYGSGGFQVRTGVPGAQAYFDNGMQLAHAFAHKPATQAFQEAVKLDPACAMCLWGEAWSRGPTINYPIDEKEQATLAAMTDRAAVLAKDGPVKEQRLIAALQKRYRRGGGKGPGDDAFAQAMDQLARDYPTDNEIAVIAADAWMIPAATRENRAHLDRALVLLGGALARKPTDTGAIHFYIHATEMEGIGGQAEAYADTLQRLAPSASHLTHMPSHTYYIVGRYEDAVKANLGAIKLDADNAVRQGMGGDAWKLSYHAHNVQFAMGAALMSGDAAAALGQSGAVLERAKTVKTANGWNQLVVATALFAQARYAPPQQTLAIADPGADTPVLRDMWRYARGEAYARLGDAAGVRRELAEIKPVPAAELKGFDDYGPQATAMVDAARLVLEGRAEMIEGKPAAAAEVFRTAAAIQDARLARLSDPPGWWYPIRRSYAAALLEAGKADAAAAQARQTLKTWPQDPVTLAVLAQAERKLGDGKAADLHLAQARKGWVGGAMLAAAARLGAA